MSPETADPFVHEALFYRDKDDFLAGTVPFVFAAVAAGEPVLVAVPEPKIALLRDQLGEHADGVRFVDITQAGRNPGRIIPGVLMAFSAGVPATPVRIIGEPMWPGRSDLEYPACVQHEAMVNSTFAGRSCTIMCSYDMAGLGEEVLEDAERTHPIVVDQGTRRPSPYYTDPAVVAEAYNIPLPPPPPDATPHGFAVGNLAHTRKVVERFATESGLRRELVEDLVLAVNELATNSILHATGHGVLRMWCENRTVVCEVADEGTPNGWFPSTFNGVGGFGIVMVNLLCDLVRTHMSHTGTTIRVYLGQ